ncbi:MAG TPA: ATP-binding protein, partial [Anaeromyxobacter sp.]
GRPLRFEETPLARALAGETVRSAHLCIEGPGGRAWIVSSAAPIRAPGGVIHGAVVTFSDESAIHALEEARDDLVRMVSHDLRSPLNAILAQVHMLRRAPFDAADVEARARAIARSCGRMNAMIQDLLEATLLEASQLRMHTRSIDLAAAVQDVLERQRGVLAMDRVRFSTRGAPPPVATDPDRLERIVVNLVSNALKYSPEQGEVTVEIAAAEGGATLTVTDRGIGIAPEDAAHVFERFFRARGARRPEGLGLGLYITRLLVDAHGGRIEVESRLGQGSTFRVFLPEEAPLRTPGGRT